MSSAQPSQSNGPHTRPTSRIPRWLRAYALEQNRLQWWILLFVLLSIADLVVTYWMLSISPDFYESNPIANWFFKKWNIAGMTFFKFAVVAFVIIISDFVERRRAGYGRFVLILGSLATAAVVVYSIKLYQSVKIQPF